MFRLKAFMAERVPWRYGRLYFRTRGRLIRFVRWLRYRPVPLGGWGEGWRVLVFRYDRRGEPRRQLHVLAPVRGDEFDWDLLKRLVRGEIRPRVQHEAGHLTGEMRWAGAHIGVTTEVFGTQRVPMNKLVPGEFRGGVDVSLVLLDVREARLQDDAA